MLLEGMEHGCCMLYLKWSEREEAGCNAKCQVDQCSATAHARDMHGARREVPPPGTPPPANQAVPNPEGSITGERIHKIRGSTRCKRKCLLKVYVWFTDKLPKPALVPTRPLPLGTKSGAPL